MVENDTQHTHNKFNIRWVPAGENYIAINPATGDWLLLDPTSRRIVEEMDAGMELAEIVAAHPNVTREDVGYLLQKIRERDFTSTKDVDNFVCTDCHSGHYPTLGVLNLTERCNLKCTYCYVGAGENQVEYMKPETAYRIIDEFLAMCPNEHPNITMHGGEPLLDFSLVEKIVNYAKPFRDRMDLSMQTNATLLTEERVKFLKENNVSIGVSIDGPQKYHDQTRKLQSGEGSFEQVMRGIRLMQKHGLLVGTISVLTAHDIEHADEIVEFFAKNGIFDLSLMPMQRIGRGIQDTDSYMSGEQIFRGFQKVIDKIIEINSSDEYAHKINERKSSQLAKSIFYRIQDFMCMRAPCGAGRNILGFGIHGDFYLCDDFINDPEFRIGSVYEGSIPEQMRNSEMLREKIKRAMHDLPRCRDCTWRQLCGGVCFSTDHYTGANGIEKIEMCEFYEKIIPYLIQKFAENRDLPGLIDFELKNSDNIFYIRANDGKDKIDGDCMEALMKVHGINHTNEVYLDWNRSGSGTELQILLKEINKVKAQNVLVIDPEAAALSAILDELLSEKATDVLRLVPGRAEGSDLKHGLEKVGEVVRHRNQRSTVVLQVKLPLLPMLAEQELLLRIASYLSAGDSVELTGVPESEEETEQLNALLTKLRGAKLEAKLFLRNVAPDMLEDNNLIYASVSEKKKVVYIDEECFAGRAMDGLPE